MQLLLTELNYNYKVDKVKKKLNPSLEDNLDYESLEIIIKTSRPFIQRLKTIYLTPNVKDQYFIKIYSDKDPMKTVLKSLYESNKMKDWEKPLTCTDKPVIYLKGDIQVLNKVINYMYSILN